jgi:hypothetical protein
VQTPLSTDERNMVRSELQAIVRSPNFRSSKRYPAFLTYIVEKTLDGEASELKERTIGIDVFERPADYDTNGDPIVRNTASEVRRRLSLYNAEAPTDHLVSIHLPAGSYRPELRFASSSASATSASDDAPPLPIAVNINGEALAKLDAGKRFRMTGLYWLVVFALILIGSLIGWRVSISRVKPLDGFWYDFFNTRNEVMIVIPGQSLPPAGPLPSNWRNNNRNIAIEDASAMERASGLLALHDIRYRRGLESATTFADLRNRPVILIGGRDNQWTMRLLAPLRYHIVDGIVGGLPTFGLAIEDAENPQNRWIYNDGKSDDILTKDYAIVARFHDQSTGGVVMVIAGTGRNGTEAAGDFVTSPEFLAEASKRLPSGWQKRNIEIVLQTNVINNETGAPVIVASDAW